VRRLRPALLVVVATLAVAAPAFALDVQYQLTGPPGANGWYVGPVTVKWTVTGETGTSNCDTTTLTRDTAGTPLTCTATDGGGGTFSRTAVVRIDQTAPGQIAVAAARPPDSAGWYTASVALSWSGTDATSGIASCTTTTYAGPDSPGAALAGTCTDKAGNVSAPLPFALAFDATPPALADVIATVAGPTATVRWTPGADVVATSVVRQGGEPLAVPLGDHQITDGPLAAGKAYTWTVTVRDAAGNATSVDAAATVPAARLASASASRRPTLRWKTMPNARYYNLQLYRSGRKVLSAWPTKPHYTLPRTWRLHGRTHRLTAGVYRWYAWPGYGPRAQHRYGRLLAKGKVTVSAAAAKDAGRS
jgi:hypothetical protein